MSLNVSAASDRTFELVPQGQYVARCFKIIDLGTQTAEYMGQTKFQKKVLISWELLDGDHMDDGRPFSATKKYTASLDERGHLRKDLEAWRGKPFTDAELESFDLTNVLGAYCQLQIVHSEDGKYANVNAIMGFKGEKPKGVNELVSFDIDNPDMKVFETLGDKLKEQIQAAPEFKFATQEMQTKELKTAEGEPDVVIEDFGEEPINLADIPF